MIDLSTLIALLTAIATATSSSSADNDTDAEGRTDRACAHSTTSDTAEPTVENPRGPQSPQPAPSIRESVDDATDASNERYRADDPGSGEPENSDAGKLHGQSDDRADKPTDDDPTDDDPTDDDPTDDDPTDNDVDEQSGEDRSGHCDATGADATGADGGPPSSGDSTRDGRGRSSTSTEAGRPTDVLDLTNWYLTLPTGAASDPDTVEQPDLTAYRSPYFQLNNAGDGVVLTAPAGGVTTQNSSYPRTELREMNGEQKAAWSNTSGTHTLTVRQAVTQLPDAKPETVTAQIHDGRDDVLQIRLEAQRLMVQYDDGKKETVLDPNYKLGTRYDIQITAADSRVVVTYNGGKEIELPLSGAGWYFKAGAYAQSNTSKGDTPTAAAQVVIYALEVIHAV